MNPQIACTDVFYLDDQDEANAACIMFDSWDARKETCSFTERVHGIAPYEPGFFFKRELPCLLALFKRAPAPFSAVLVDGLVWLDADGKPGLGAHLFEALGRAVPVIGVAKTSFMGGEFATKLLRGTSSRPLFVNAAGIDNTTAAGWVRQMSGPNRLPKFLKDVDTLCRKV